MKKNTAIRTMKVMVVGATLLTFPGCGLIDYLKEKFGSKKEVPKVCNISFAQADAKNSGPVLATIAGKPALYKSEFDNHLVQMLQAYPQLRGVLSPESLPLGLKKAVLGKLVEQELIIAWGEKANVEQDPEFQKAYLDAMKNVRKLLFVQQFEKQMLGKIEAYDQDVRSEYDKNKARYIKSIGGVALNGISFDTEEKAKSFFAKVKGKESEFETLAKSEMTGNVKNFGRVNEDSPLVPAPIKEFALSAKTYPAMSVVNTGKEFWVVDATDKKDTEYRDFDEVKGQIEGMIRSQKFQEMVESKMSELKREFTVEINDCLLGEEKQFAAADVSFAGEGDNRAEAEIQPKVVAA